MCPLCRIPAVVHKDRGSGRKDHFAHNPPLTPLIGYGETALHKAAKTEICDALTSIWPNGKWQVERRIEKDVNKQAPELRPDISGNIGEQPLVIEVQMSTLSLATILRRSKGYHKIGKPVLWILPLRKKLEGEFRPRLFERYLHTMYFGRVYYWMIGDGIRVTPTHFVPVERWVETREWFDSNGEEQSGGGYPKKLRLLKTALPEKQINIAENFQSKKRDEFIFGDGKNKIPILRLWQDTLPIWWNENEESIAQKKWDEADEI